jgi:hypothetical protein
VCYRRSGRPFGMTKEVPVGGGQERGLRYQAGTAAFLA